jgi:hypothetical protein
VADVEGALAQAAAEDGGPLFECRPRGLPPGKVGRILAAVVIVAPFLSGWCDVAALRVRGRDHPRRWTGDWSHVWLHVDDERGVTHSERAHGPGWGPSSPLLKGVDVPWLLLGAVGFATLELLRYARYRSRRIVVTRIRVLVAEGIVGVHVHEWWRTVHPTLVVRRGDAVLWSTRPVHLGRLDPLDLIELAAKVGAAPHRPALRRPRRWGLLAVAGLAGGLLLLGLTRPWSGTLRVERGAGGLADQVTLTIDGPAWGPRRTVAPLHDQSGGLAWVPSSSLSQARDFAPTTPAHRAAACQVTLLEGDGQVVALMASALQAATNGWLRREERRSVQALADEAQGGPHPAPRRRATATRALRVGGRLHFVEGDPVAFDVTLGPGEAVTLDLAELREQAGR